MTIFKYKNIIKQIENRIFWLNTRLSIIENERIERKDPELYASGYDIFTYALIELKALLNLGK